MATKPTSPSTKAPAAEPDAPLAAAADAGPAVADAPAAGAPAEELPVMSRSHLLAIRSTDVAGVVRGLLLTGRWIRCRIAEDAA